MASESQDTSKFSVGDWVIVSSPGPFFGKVGEIVEAANAQARERGIEWWVLFTVDAGAGFQASDLMRDPRWGKRPKPVEE